MYREGILFYNITWVEIFSSGGHSLRTLKKYSRKTACIYLKGLLKSRFFPSIANASRNCTYLCFSFYLSSVLYQIPHDFGLARPSSHVQRCFSSLGKKSQNKVTAALKKSGMFCLHEAYDVGFLFYK